MRDPFFLLIPDDLSAPAHWYAPATAERPEVSGTGALAEAAPAATGRRVVGFIPANHVLISRAALPTRNRQRMLMAVPYALEEQLISDVDTLHFALGRSAGSDLVPVAVVDAARMQTWRDGLRAAGLDPEALTPETLSLPWETDTWSVLVTPANAVLRTGAQAGLAVDTDNIGAVLRSMLSDPATARPQRLRVYTCAQAPAAQPALAELAQEFAIPMESDACEDGVLRLLTGNYRADDAINLLQGRFSRTEQLSRLWRPWRATAVLAGIWLLAVYATNVMSYTRLTGIHQDLQEQVEQLYRQTFPDARNVVDPRAQMEHHLAQLQSGGGSAGFLELISTAAPALRAVPGLEIENLRGQEGELELEMSLNDLQALDQLKQRLSAAPNLAVEIVSATSRDGKVAGRLKIRYKST